VDRIARDLMLPMTTLRTAAGGGPDAADQLQFQIAASGLSRAAIERQNPAVLRDLERCCSTCDEKKRCKRDLARSAHEARWPEYCPNAMTLASLAIVPGQSQEP
jgi:hypothetical protein